MAAVGHLGFSKFKTFNSWAVKTPILHQRGIVRIVRISQALVEISRFFDARWSLNCPAVKKLNFKNPRWPTSSILKSINRDIPATVLPILIKFGMTMFIVPLDRTLKLQVFENLRHQRAKFGV